MAESNSTEEISGGNQQSSQICCIVCKRSRCYKKYRRHLKTHVTHGELNAEDVSKIMFKCHQTRCDIKVFSQDKTQRGYVCHYQTESKKECGHIVLDLKRHLKKVHNLDTCSSMSEDLIEKGLSEKPLKRKLDTKCTNEDNGEQSNPSHKRVSSSHEVGDSMTNFRIQSEISLSTSTSIPADRSDSDIYNFESDSESDDCVFELNSVPHQDDLNLSTISHPFSSSAPTLTPCGSCIPTNLGLHFMDSDKIIKEFNTFMLSKGGGGRRNTPIKGDISSFRCLVKDIGWANLWNVNALNSYVSSATCSPSTTYGRLRVYERFVYFLRSEYPNLLPHPERMQAINSMLAALKEALG